MVAQFASAVRAVAESGAAQFDPNLLIAPAAVLLGVVVSQTITVITDRRRRTAEQLKEARTAAEDLLKLFQTYRDLIGSSLGMAKSDPTKTERDEWVKVAPAAARAAAVLPGKGGHRRILERLIEGLTYGEQIAREGEGLTDSTHRDYWVMADLGFETAASWLRFEEAPRQVRRQDTRLKRSLYWYRLEMRARDEFEKTGNSTKSGLVRRAWRKSVRWVRARIQPLRLRINAAWGYLFRA